MKNILFLLLFFPFFIGMLKVASAAERRSAVVDVIEKIGPAVVNIRTEQVVSHRRTPFFGFGDSFFEEFFSQFGPTHTYKTQSIGSGVIVDPRGYLLTNAHVVEKASKIFVALLGENKERKATLVGFDGATDLAVIKLETDKPLPSLKAGRSEDLMLGETVIAIGNPFGLENSVTTGVISAPRRRFPDGNGGLAVFIQTDALINPGNSGGPLINIHGELIGINTSIARQAQGIGFAIPIDLALRIANELIDHSKVRVAYSGLFADDISPAMARSRGYGGALATRIDNDSPAKKAGLQVADVILAVDGVRVETASELFSLLRTYAPGNRTSLSLLRGMSELKTSMIFSEIPKDYIVSYIQRIFGLMVTQNRRGVLVKTVIAGSPADQIEIKPGDVLAEIEGIPIQTKADFFLQMEKHVGRLPLKILIVRANRGYLVEIP